MILNLVYLGIKYIDYVLFYDGKNIIFLLRLSLATSIIDILYPIEYNILNMCEIQN